MAKLIYGLTLLDSDALFLPCLFLVLSPTGGKFTEESGIAPENLILTSSLRTEVRSLVGSYFEVFLASGGRIIFLVDLSILTV